MVPSYSPELLRKRGKSIVYLLETMKINLIKFYPTRGDEDYGSTLNPEGIFGRYGKRTNMFRKAIEHNYCDKRFTHDNHKIAVIK